jgi:alkylation response protein AidB-like acyl-CoA dehydrogenase
MNQPDETTLLEAAKDLRPRILAERERIEAGRRLPDDLVSARLFLFDTIERVWRDVIAGREPTVDARAHGRLATWHAVTSACQAVDLVYLAGGATSLYANYPIERAFRDVHAITQHIGVHPRTLETVGRILFGLEPDVPLLML